MKFKRQYGSLRNVRSRLGIQQEETPLTAHRTTDELLTKRRHKWYLPPSNRLGEP
jgi:hypothetical protein